MNKYVVLDTNVIVSFFENGFSIVNQKGTLSQPENFEILQNLWKILKENKITLLIPEVVVIECERIMNEKLNELDKLHEKVKEGVQNAVTINRKISSESSNSIENTINSINKKEKNKIEKSWKLLNRIIKHKNTTVIKIDEEIIVNSYKRGLMGKKPFTMKYTSKEVEIKPIHDIQPDCIVVESIKKFIKSKTDYELFLCTNDSNFYETNEKKNLDNFIKVELNIKQHFLSISDFLFKVFNIQSKSIPIEVTEESMAYPVIDENQNIDGGINIDSGMVKNINSSVK